jgi:ELP3 family radical SAM enzyme/protein acetyltransferase
MSYETGLATLNEDGSKRHNNTVNIEDVVNDPVLYEKTKGYMRTLVVGHDYTSRDELDLAVHAAGEKHDVHPKNRLDVNLLYWRYLGERQFERNKSFEKFSLAPLQAAVADPDIEEAAEAKSIEMEAFVRSLVTKEFATGHEYDKAIQLTRREFKFSPNKLSLQKAYWRLVNSKLIEPHAGFEHFGVKKGVRSNSGVLVVTVLTSPYPEGADGEKGRFDCAYDCAFCPSEPGMPRSYISTEPAVRRAIQNNWDPVEQFVDRVGMLAECGHVLDKFEVLVLGGTWSSYPMEYRENFVRDMYYAANCRLFLPEAVREIRPRLSLAEERVLNEVADHRIIGLTLETRPDCINSREIRHLRNCGCTRVQMGIQHTDDDVLAKIQRQCSSKHNKRGLRLLKDAGFKVDIHLMPDLPGSSPEQDRAMFKEVITGPDLQADQWKIYPTSVVRHSLIEKWYEDGSYKPYSEDGDKGQKLIDVICDVKAAVPPWIRLNRVIRDIPEISIVGGNDDTNMRQKLEKILIARGTPCNCIRCREVRDDTSGMASAELVVREYPSSGGTEYFISFESPDGRDPEAEHYLAVSARYSLAVAFLGFALLAGPYYSQGNFETVAPLFPWLYVAACLLIIVFMLHRWSQSKLELAGRLKAPYRRDTIYAFLRLRINGDPEANTFTELRGAGLIRELHVYGRLTSVQDKLSKDRPQHSGFGRRLIDRAVEITRVKHDLQKLAVISGDGVKGYYRKQGFEDDGQYLTRKLI